MEIRLLEPQDETRLAEIYLESRKETFHWMPENSFHLSDFDQDTLDEEIHVALDGDIPVGFISVWQPDNFIHHLYIDSKYQNQGIGKKLLNHALAKMERPAGLKCVVQNKRAVEFYKSQGWEVKETAEDEMGPYYYFVLKN